MVRVDLSLRICEVLDLLMRYCSHHTSTNTITCGLEPKIEKATYMAEEVISLCLDCVRH